MQGPARTGSSPAYRETASKQAHADEQRAAGCCQPAPCASGCSALSSGSRGRCSGEPGCRNWNLKVADMNPGPPAWRHNLEPWTDLHFILSGDARGHQETRGYQRRPTFPMTAMSQPRSFCFCLFFRRRFLPAFRHCCSAFPEPLSSPEICVFGCAPAAWAMKGPGGSACKTSPDLSGSTAMC